MAVPKTAALPLGYTPNVHSQTLFGRYLKNNTDARTGKGIPTNMKLLGTNFRLREKSSSPKKKFSFLGWVVVQHADHLVRILQVVWIFNQDIFSADHLFRFQLYFIKSF